MSAGTALNTKEVLVKMVVVRVAELILAIPDRELTGTVLVRLVKLISLFQKTKGRVLYQIAISGRGSLILESVRIAPTTRMQKRTRPSVRLMFAIPGECKSNGTELVGDAETKKQCHLTKNIA